MASGMIKNPHDTSFTQVPLTYVTNDIVLERDFNRCRCYRLDRFAIFYLNLGVEAVAATDFTTIGTISKFPFATVMAGFPIQSTQDNCTIMITASGAIQIYKPNTSTGFARGVITFGLETL